MSTKQTWKVLIPVLFIFTISISAEESHCEIYSFWTRISKPDCTQDKSNSVLWCANQNFTCIPNWPWNFGKKLILSRNKIRILSNKIFARQFTNNLDFERVLELDLSYNQIDTIHPQAFIGLKSLETLNLSYNSLSQVPSPSFAPLFELKILHLSGNPIKNIQVTDFENIPKLCELNLISCEISTLNQSPFQNLPNLKVLRLNSNFLTELSSEVFEGLENLQTLDLRNNELVTVEIGVGEWPPKSVPRLTWLRIDENPFKKTLPKPSWYKNYLNIFRQISSDPERKENCEKQDQNHFHCKLRIIDQNWSYECSGNSINCIPQFDLWLNHKIITIKNTQLDILDANIFKRQISEGRSSNILRLNLTSNQLKFIHQDAFIGLNSLKTLDLSRNQLNSVPFKAFQNINSVQIIMDSNPLFLDEDFEPSFTKIPPLTELSLRNCGLNKKFFEILKMCSLVKNLDVGENLITEIQIPSNEVLQESVTEILTLSKNLISSFSFVFDPYFGHLKELNLDQNPIILNLLPNHGKVNNVLAVLNLRKCNISTIPAEAFSGLRNLRSLHLDGNFLKTDRFTIAGLLNSPKLLHIKLGGNKNSIRRDGTAMTRQNSAVVGNSCNCNQNLQYCLGTWAEKTQDEIYHLECKITNRWYRALKFLGSFNPIDLTVYFTIAIALMVPAVALTIVAFGGFVPELSNILFY